MINRGKELVIGSRLCRDEFLEFIMTYEPSLDLNHAAMRPRSFRL